MAGNGCGGRGVLGTGCAFLILGLLRMIQNEFGKIVPSTLGQHDALRYRIGRHHHRDDVRGVEDLEEEDAAEREPLMSQKRITRDDLESQFRQLQDNVHRTVDDKRNAMLTAGVSRWHRRGA